MGGEGIGVDLASTHAVDLASTHAVMNKAVVVLVDCNLRTGPTQLRGEAAPRRLEAAQGDRGAWASGIYVERACWPAVQAGPSEFGPGHALNFGRLDSLRERVRP